MVSFWGWNNKRRQSEREHERAEDLKLKPRFNENNFKAFGIIFRGNRLQRAKNVAVILCSSYQIFTISNFLDALN